MKKVILATLALSMCMLSVEAKTPKKDKNKKGAVEETTVLANRADSVSYAFGVYLGNDLGNNLSTFPGVTINKDVLVRGIAQALKGDSVPMTAEFASQYFQTFMMEAQQKEADNKREAGEKFLEENKKRPEVKTTASGLQYEILTPAEGAKPVATDNVKVHYVGKLVDGTTFDSSVDRGEPITFPLNQVIPGWTEGVQLMSPGAKYKFYLPYNLAYGERGAGNTIPPYSTLIFEVELLEINPTEN